jgi:hypothetical protein
MHWPPIPHPFRMPHDAAPAHSWLFSVHPQRALTQTGPGLHVVVQSTHAPPSPQASLPLPDTQ